MSIAFNDKTIDLNVEYTKGGYTIIIYFLFLLSVHIGIEHKLIRQQYMQ